MMNFSYFWDGGLGILMGILSSMPVFTFWLASYVLMALGLYTLAKRRGITSPWLAWLPIADSWILGSLSDQYRYVVRGQIRSKRKVLLTLNILRVVLRATIIGLIASIGASVIFGADFNNPIVVQHLMRPSIGLLVLAALLVLTKIIVTIFYFMAMYDVYTSCDPENSVLYLVFSILFRVTRPFFVFFNRNKDGGMPPRRDTYQREYCEV